MRQLRAGPHDREILRLAIPAFGALAAEPLYVLADTAIVGHLGTRPLGGLGVAGAILSVAFGIFNFLAYGTTATVARRIGAGDRKSAAEHGVAGVWLALGLGLALAAVGLALSGPVVSAMGTSARVAPYAAYLPPDLADRRAVRARGARRHRLPTRPPGHAHPAGHRTRGQRREPRARVGARLRRPSRHRGLGARDRRRPDRGRGRLPRDRPPQRARFGRERAPDLGQLRAAGTVGAFLTVRTGTLLLAFTAATSIASRIGDAEVAAHQIAFQLWLLLALCLDAIAIAGQAIVGRALGAGDADLARAASRRMLQWGVLVGAGLGALVLALDPLLALAFTRDAAVRAQLRPVLVMAALMQPIGGAVFVLDGILIGAGDVRFLALAMAAATVCFVPCAIAVLASGAGLIALWSALFVFMFARLLGMGGRFRANRWLVTGASGT